MKYFTQAAPLPSYGSGTLDVYGSAVAPVGTSAPGNVSHVSHVCVNMLLF